ncbi:MAG: threonylcarbamoyl-AMP synthase [Alphaproteobacteria bacterium]|uniref:L-threonylcarbamoyladenylate synthase n=1 Tax=Candidatus Nitrobium versatile TaxID=2884831 RepID=A0A953JC97_9BACT|nr:threonylcarbamoyl-AMP synthase [Candidatus Nitrobium versatile]
MTITLARETLETALREAVATLQGGGIIAYPTETFYGLGAKYDILSAIERIYEVKRRPAEKAMPLIIGRRELLPLLTDSVSAQAEELMRTFWPGPLTLLFSARSVLPAPLVSGGRVAVRIPGESFALRLALKADFPITATSANISAHPPARSLEMILDYFGDSLDCIIDGGESPGNIPSTIVDVAGEKIALLRKGAVDIPLR